MVMKRAGEVWQKDLFASALSETDVVIQPRQSNTWDHFHLTMYTNLWEVCR